MENDDVRMDDNLQSSPLGLFELDSTDRDSRRCVGQGNAPWGNFVHSRRIGWRAFAGNGPRRRRRWRRSLRVHVVVKHTILSRWGMEWRYRGERISRVALLLLSSSSGSEVDWVMTVESRTARVNVCTPLGIGNDDDDEEEKVC